MADTMCSANTVRSLVVSGRWLPPEGLTGNLVLWSRRRSSRVPRDIYSSTMIGGPEISLANELKLKMFKKVGPFLGNQFPCLNFW